jgi:hypothetical protein
MKARLRTDTKASSLSRQVLDAFQQQELSKFRLLVFHNHSGIHQPQLCEDRLGDLGDRLSLRDRHSGSWAQRSTAVAVLDHEQHDRSADGAATHITDWCHLGFRLQLAARHPIQRPAEPAGKLGSRPPRPRKAFMYAARYKV